MHRFPANGWVGRFVRQVHSSSGHWQTQKQGGRCCHTLSDNCIRTVWDYEISPYQDHLFHMQCDIVLMMMNIFPNSVLVCWCNGMWYMKWILCATNWSFSFGRSQSICSKRMNTAQQYCIIISIIWLTRVPHSSVEIKSCLKYTEKWRISEIFF